MSALQRFVAQPQLDDGVLPLLAKHIALDLLPEETLTKLLGLNTTELERVRHSPEFEGLVRRERSRLLTVDGQREVNEWKQALTENQYWDRLMSLGLNVSASATALIDGMKVVKRPNERGGAPGQGGAGGPQFVVNITIPNAPALQVTTTVVDSQAEEVA